MKTRLLVPLMLGLAAGVAPAAGSDSATFALDLRLRTEVADQRNGLKQAHAETLRTRLGLGSPRWHGLSVYVEYEGTAALGRERYNSGPGGNGETAYSVIADPTGAELNQAWVEAAPVAGTRLRVGRQRIGFDDARFVGNVGWRQNEQTFDAAWLSTALGEKLKLNFAWLGNANTVLYANMDMQTPLANIRYQYLPGHAVTAYGYWIDRSGAGDSRSEGLRLSGRIPATSTLGFHYLAEAARQRPYADAPDTVTAAYRRVEFGAVRAGMSLRLGWERLGGDGQYGFATPLATLHKFNGWADVFLATPAEGLRDSYVRLGWGRGAWKMSAAWHRFEADVGGADYGRELDLVLGYSFVAGTRLVIKSANFQARDFATDTRKFWVEASHRF